MTKVLLLGAYGQVGQELISALAPRIGMSNIVCTDIREPPKYLNVTHHHIVDSVNAEAVESIVQKYKITQIYCLTALLSAKGEQNPMVTQNINMKSLLNCLEAARKFKLEKIFWPSSIAAFGEDTPKQTPQQTIMNPSTAYGITKKAGELWCAYYARKFGVDVRSVRYPGLVGYKSIPAGGTTDYAVQIFYKALKNQVFHCFLSSQTYLPMIYTDDAIDATLLLMDAPKSAIKIRTSYNIEGMSFCPRELAKQIQKHIPTFKIEYRIDPLRQKIADSWPRRLEDSNARKDWNFSPKYDIAKMTKHILENLKV